MALSWGFIRWQCLWCHRVVLSEWTHRENMSLETVLWTPTIDFSPKGSVPTDQTPEDSFVYLIFGMCVRVWYTYMFLYIYTQVYGGQRWTSVCRFPHSFLRQNLSLNLELPRMQVGLLGGQWAPRIYLPLPSSTGVRCSPPCPAFAWLLGYWDSNSGPHAYRADTLPMEPSSQPWVGRILGKKEHR